LLTHTALQESYSVVCPIKCLYIQPCVHHWHKNFRYLPKSASTLSESSPVQSNQVWLSKTCSFTQPKSCSVTEGHSNAMPNKLIWYSCVHASLVWFYNYNQQDATIFDYLLLNGSTCFGWRNRPKHVAPFRNRYKK